MLPAIAGMMGGCADSRMAASNAGAGAQASGETAGAAQPAYRTAYGLSSDGLTTDLYTELFGGNARDDKNAPATASSGTVQQGPPAPAPSASSAPSGVRQQPTRAQQSARAQEPARAAPAPASPAPVAGVAQQETATPQAPPPTATAYGIPSNGFTTDLYTALFGSKNHEQ